MSLLLLPSNQSFSIRNFYPGQHSPGFRPLDSNSYQEQQQRNLEPIDSPSTPSSSSIKTKDYSTPKSYLSFSKSSSKNSESRHLLLSEPSSPPPSFYSNNHLNRSHSQNQSLDHLSLPRTISTSELYTIYLSPASNSSINSLDSDSITLKYQEEKEKILESESINPFQAPQTEE